MADLVLRGMDGELVRRVRSAAALDGMKVKEWASRILEAGLRETDSLVRKSEPAATDDREVDSETHVPVVAKEPQETREATGKRGGVRLGMEKSVPDTISGNPECPECCEPMLDNVRLKQWNCKCGFVQRKR